MTLHPDFVWEQELFEECEDIFLLLMHSATKAKKNIQKINQDVQKLTIDFSLQIRIIFLHQIWHHKTFELSLNIASSFFKKLEPVAHS